MRSLQIRPRYLTENRSFNLTHILIELICNCCKIELKTKLREPSICRRNIQLFIRVKLVPKTDSISEIAIPKRSFREISETKVSSSKIATIKPKTIEETFSQVRDTSPIHSRQIQPPEISFSSSVSSQQFLSSNFSHNNSSVLIMI